MTGEHVRDQHPETEDIDAADAPLEPEVPAEPARGAESLAQGGRRRPGRRRHRGPERAALTSPRRPAADRQTATGVRAPGAGATPCERIRGNHPDPARPGGDTRGRSRHRCTPGSSPGALRVRAARDASATWSSVTLLTRSVNWAGSGSSWVTSPWSAAVGHHSWAVLRAARSDGPQHIVTWPKRGPAPPARR